MQQRDKQKQQTAHHYCSTGELLHNSHDWPNSLPWLNVNITKPSTLGGATVYQNVSEIRPRLPDRHMLQWRQHYHN